MRRTIRSNSTDKGVEFLSGQDDPNFFVMPEMGMEIAKIEEVRA
jgi:preprotein translocase subunit SecA